MKFQKLLVGLCLVLLSSCSQEDKGDEHKRIEGGAAAPVVGSVRVGYLRLLSATPLYTAIREGYFAEEGVNVQLRVIKSGPEGNEALAAGNLDVAFSILPSLIVANVQGVPADLVSIYGASIDGPQVRDHRIIVQKDSSISGARDLANKKVAIVGWPGKTSDVLEFLDFLDRHGMREEQVTLVGMAHGDMVGALASGIIDAAACAEPYINLGVIDGQVKTLEQDEGYYYHPQNESEVTTYLARRSWMDANVDTAARFLRAIDRGRVKAEDRNWLVEQGLPSFNVDHTPPIDFVRLSSEKAAQLRFMPIRPQASIDGLRHVTEQLLRHGPISQGPSDLESLIWRAKAR